MNTILKRLVRFQALFFHVLQWSHEKNYVKLGLPDKQTKLLFYLRLQNPVANFMCQFEWVMGAQISIVSECVREDVSRYDYYLKWWTH